MRWWQDEILKKAGLDGIFRTASAEAEAAQETYAQLRDGALYLEELSTSKLKVRLGLGSRSTSASSLQPVLNARHSAPHDLFR